MSNVKSYTLDYRLRIKNPGKFEGEPLWLVFLYEVVMEGGAMEDTIGEDGYQYSYIDIHEDLLDEFEAIVGRKDAELRDLHEEKRVIVLWETTDGFVRYENIAPDEVEKHRESVTGDEEEDPNEEADIRYDAWVDRQLAGKEDR